MSKKLIAFNGLAILGVGATATTLVALSIDSGGKATLDSPWRGDDTPDAAIPNYQLVFHGMPSGESLDWGDGEIDTYNPRTIAYNLKKNKNTKLLSEKASPEAWTSRSLKVLDDHANTSEDYLNRYSSEFRLFVLDMKRNYSDSETRKASWGNSLKALCGVNYTKSYRGEQEDKATLTSLNSLCTVPESRGN